MALIGLTAGAVVSLFIRETAPKKRALSAVQPG
jgi:hypothetical protein